MIRDTLDSHPQTSSYTRQARLVGSTIASWVLGSGLGSCPCSAGIGRVALFRTSLRRVAPRCTTSCSQLLIALCHTFPHPAHHCMTTMAQPQLRHNQCTICAPPPLLCCAHHCTTTIARLFCPPGHQYHRNTRIPVMALPPHNCTYLHCNHCLPHPHPIHHLSIAPPPISKAAPPNEACTAITPLHHCTTLFTTSLPKPALHPH